MSVFKLQGFLELMLKHPHNEGLFQVTLKLRSINLPLFLQPIYQLQLREVSNQIHDQSLVYAIVITLLKFCEI